MASATYNVKEKKCATCSYWNGERSIEFSANKPWLIKIIVGNSVCIAEKNKKVTPGQTCNKWKLWEKIG